jgi:ankyrin repeat protein
LLKAVLLSNHDIVAYLLSVGADPNLSVERSFNSVQCAIIYSDDRMIYLLIKAGGYVEEGESWYDDYKRHYDTIIRTGLLKEEDIPQRRFERTVERLAQQGEKRQTGSASTDATDDDEEEDDDDQQMFNDR